MKGVAVFFLVCLISFNIDTGSALKCYSCTAAVGQKSDCELDVKKVDTLDCTEGLDACYTLITKGDLAGVVRSCMTKNACELISKDTYKLCKTCTSDLCNTDSSGFVPSYSTSLAVSVVLFTLSKLFM